jgi:hypothetical protein
VRLVFGLYTSHRLSGKTVARALNDRGHRRPRTATAASTAMAPASPRARYDTGRCSASHLDADATERAVLARPGSFYRDQHDLIADDITRAPWPACGPTVPSALTPRAAGIAVMSASISGQRLQHVPHRHGVDLGIPAPG